EIKLVRQDIEIKRIEAEKIIAEIVKIKLNEKKVFEEQEELRIAKEKEFQEIQNQKNINNLTSKS
ncbi:MAG: hypothetical protein Q8M44_00275, partial [bacterium]|nr:hypothetical protein [bacterium]